MNTYVVFLTEGYKWEHHVVLKKNEQEAREAALARTELVKIVMVKVTKVDEHYVEKGGF